MRKRNPSPRPERLLLFKDKVLLIEILHRLVVEYGPRFERELLLLPDLVGFVALSVYLRSIAPPVTIEYPRLLGRVEAERGGVVGKEQDETQYGVDPAFKVVRSPDVPGTVVKNVRSSLWRVLCSVQVFRRLVWEKP
jgi:hypothetical protein